MSYYLAPSLVQLRNEVNQRWPNRSKISDGWIGDASHSARKSDHNPDWSAPGRRRGVVRALDVTARGINVPLLLKHTTNDPRTAYVIYNRRIYTHKRGWYTYRGPNPHTNHVHISIGHTAARENQTYPWFGSATTSTATASTATKQKGSWFDMATKQDLRGVLREERVQPWLYKGKNEDWDTYAYLRKTHSLLEKLYDNVGRRVWSYKNHLTDTDIYAFLRATHRQVMAAQGEREGLMKAIEQISQGKEINLEEIRQATAQGVTDALGNLEADVTLHVDAGQDTDE